MYMVKFIDIDGALFELVKKAASAEKYKNEAKAWRMIAESLMGVKHK